MLADADLKRVPRDRPVLMTGENVVAIMRGQKAQTRRPVKKVFSRSFRGTQRDCIMDLDGEPSALCYAPRDWELCPYGEPGDRLRVRESWRAVAFYDDTSQVRIDYRADGRTLLHDVNDLTYAVFAEKERERPRTHWRPSIFMPMWASRLTLVVQTTRVQRLGDISDDDALAEGVRPVDGETPRQAFAKLWERVHGRGAWQRNIDDWMWAVTFRPEEE